MLDYWTIAAGKTELRASYMMINGPDTDAIEVVPAAALFTHFGYSPWGKGSWIYHDPDGTVPDAVFSTAEVVERISQDA